MQSNLDLDTPITIDDLIEWLSTDPDSPIYVAPSQGFARVEETQHVSNAAKEIIRGMYQNTKQQLITHLLKGKRNKRLKFKKLFSKNPSSDKVVRLFLQGFSNSADYWTRTAPEKSPFWQKFKARVLRFLRRQHQEGIAQLGPMRLSEHDEFLRTAPPEEKKQRKKKKRALSMNMSESLQAEQDMPPNSFRFTGDYSPVNVSDVRTSDKPSQPMFETSYNPPEGLGGVRQRKKRPVSFTEGEERQMKRIEPANAMRQIADDTPPKEKRKRVYEATGQTVEVKVVETPSDRRPEKKERQDPSLFAKAVSTVSNIVNNATSAIKTYSRQDIGASAAKSNNDLPVSAHVSAYGETQALVTPTIPTVDIKRNQLGDFTASLRPEIQYLNHGTLPDDADPMDDEKREWTDERRTSRSDKLRIIYSIPQAELEAQRVRSGLTNLSAFAPRSRNVVRRLLGAPEPTGLLQPRHLDFASPQPPQPSPDMKARFTVTFPVTAPPLRNSQSSLSSSSEPTRLTFGAGNPSDGSRRKTLTPSSPNLKIKDLIQSPDGKSTKRGSQLSPSERQNLLNHYDQTISETASKKTTEYLKATSSDTKWKTTIEKFKKISDADAKNLAKANWRVYIDQAVADSAWATEKKGNIDNWTLRDFIYAVQGDPMTAEEIIDLARRELFRKLTGQEIRVILTHMIDPDFSFTPRTNAEAVARYLQTALSEAKYDEVDRQEFITLAMSDMRTNWRDVPRRDRKTALEREIEAAPNRNSIRSLPGGSITVGTGQDPDHYQSPIPYPPEIREDQPEWERDLARNIAIALIAMGVATEGLTVAPGVALLEGAETGEVLTSEAAGAMVSGGTDLEKMLTNEITTGLDAIETSTQTLADTSTISTATPLLNQNTPLPSTGPSSQSPFANSNGGGFQPQPPPPPEVDNDVAMRDVADWFRDTPARMSGDQGNRDRTPRSETKETKTVVPPASDLPTSAPVEEKSWWDSISAWFNSEQPSTTIPENLQTLITEANSVNSSFDWWKNAISTAFTADVVAGAMQFLGKNTALASNPLLAIGSLLTYLAMTEGPKSFGNWWKTEVKKKVAVRRDDMDWEGEETPGEPDRMPDEKKPEKDGKVPDTSKVPDTKKNPFASFRSSASNPFKRFTGPGSFLGDRGAPGAPGAPGVPEDSGALGLSTLGGLGRLAFGWMDTDEPPKAPPEKFKGRWKAPYSTSIPETSWESIPVNVENIGLLRPEMYEGGSGLVTAMNKDTKVEVIDALMWGSFKNYQWESNQQIDNPLWHKNMAEYEVRLTGPFLDDELLDGQNETAEEIAANPDPTTAIYHTDLNMREKATENFFPVVPYEGQAASTDVNQSMVKPESEVEQEFHDVDFPDWFSIGENSPFKYMTAVAGTQYTDTERLTGQMDNYNWQDNSFENQFIFETSS